MRAKVDLGFKPQWEGPIKGWARGFINRNKWRCDPIYDLDDLMQDAYLVFMKLVDYYPDVREPKHFMALYKTALTNEMHNYARDKSDRQFPVDLERKDVKAELLEYTNWGYVAAALAEAPEELKLALAVYTNDEKLAELRTEPKRPRFSRQNLVPRESLNRKLARLAGYDPSCDVVSMLRRLFT